MLKSHITDVLNIQHSQHLQCQRCYGHPNLSPSELKQKLCRTPLGNDTNSIGSAACLPAFSGLDISVVGDPDLSQRLCWSYFDARLSSVCHLVGIAEEKQFAVTQATHPNFQNNFRLCHNEITDCNLEALAIDPIGYGRTKGFLPMALTNEARSFIEVFQRLPLVCECSAQHIFFSNWCKLPL